MYSGINSWIQNLEESKLFFQGAFGEQFKMFLKKIVRATVVIRSYMCCYAMGIAVGFNAGYTGAVLPDMVKKSILTPAQSPWFVSIATIGSTAGALAAGWLMDKLGRKNAFVISGCLMILGWIVLIMCHDMEPNVRYTILCTGRILYGLGHGPAFVVSCIYITEVSRKGIRGMLSSALGVATSSGYFLSILIGASLTWLQMAVVGLLLAGLPTLLSLGVQETPRWLILNDRMAKGKEILKTIRGSPNVDAEIFEITNAMSASKDTNSFDYRTEFFKPDIIKPFKMCVLLGMFQQFIGISCVVSYTTDIFLTAGFKEASSLAAISMCFVNWIVHILNMFFIDRAGRRLPLLVGAAGMGISCYMFATYYYFLEELKTSPPTWVGLLSIIIYIAFYGASWGPIPSMVMSEIIPSRARGFIMGVLCISEGFFRYFTIAYFPWLNETFGSHVSFGFFASASMLAYIFSYFYLPETMGRSLESIEKSFTKVRVITVNEL